MAIGLHMLGGLGRAFSRRDYRLYALGHIVHVHGWWANRVGMGWLTWELTEQPVFLGIVAFAGMVPVMVVGPLGGAMGDRYGHRLVATTAGIGSGSLTVVMGVMALSGVMTVPWLIALNVIQGFTFGIEFPTRQSLIPQLAGRENISSAVAFNATSFQVGAFVGPVLAGLLITSLGSGAPLVVSGVSSYWMVAMLALMHHRHSHRADRAETSLFSDLRDGFSYVAHSHALKSLLSLSFLSGLLIRPFNELLPGFATEIFGKGPEGFAALTAAAGFGALIGAVYLVFRGRTRGLVTIMLIGGLLGPVAIILFSQVSQFEFALGLVALGSLSLVAANVGWNSLMQSMADPAMRGRVISISASINVGAPALGALWLGWFAEQVGLQQALSVTTGVALLVVSVLALLVRGHRATMEADPDAGSP